MRSEVFGSGLVGGSDMVGRFLAYASGFDWWGGIRIIDGVYQRLGLFGVGFCLFEGLAVEVVGAGLEDVLCPVIGEQAVDATDEDLIIELGFLQIELFFLFLLRGGARLLGVWPGRGRGRRDGRSVRGGGAPGARRCAPRALAGVVDVFGERRNGLGLGIFVAGSENHVSTGRFANGGGADADEARARREENPTATRRRKVCCLRASKTRGRPRLEGSGGEG